MTTRPTKERILDAAHALFNRKGVPAVTMRQLAQAAEMSQGNLNYHFRTKEEILEALHGRLLAAARGINQSLLDDGVRLQRLRASVAEGFAVLYDYRFFLRDLNWILRESPRLRAAFKDVEAVRRAMYERVFADAVERGVMREEAYQGEHESLVTLIRVFSDYWLSSAEIYDRGRKAVIVARYAQLFEDVLYPYLTEEGQEELRRNRSRAGS